MRQHHALDFPGGEKPERDDDFVVFDPSPVPQRSPRKVESRRLRDRMLVVAGLVFAVGGASALAYWTGLWPERAAPPLVAVSSPPPAVVGLGFLEPSSTVIKIGAPGNPEATRIEALKVAEGDEVEADQVLAVLDTADRFTAQLKTSEAQVQLKRLMLEKQKLEIAYLIASRRAGLERARASLESAEAEFDRQKMLVDRSYATPSNLEKKKMDFLTARATVQEMEAALNRIEATASGVPLLKAGTLIDIAVSEQELALAEADLEVARANLAQTMIRAPFKGRILTIMARAGARIGDDGLLEMGATDSMHAVVEVYETDIGRVRLGQNVRIRGDALDRAIAGKVERIGAAVKRQSVVNNDPATATDARVVEVFVALDDETSRKVSALSRLQVQAVFEQ